MRKLFLGISWLVTLLLGGLLVFTVETAAEEMGYVEYVRNLVSGGVIAVIDWRYADWILVGFSFFLGASIALVLDGQVRKRLTVQIPRKTRIVKR